MLEHLVKTLDTCIKYHERKGNKVKADLLRKKKEEAKLNSLHSQDDE